MGDKDATKGEGAADPCALDADLLDVVDAALELHNRRTSVTAINNFVRHMTKTRGFNVNTARALCSTNPKEYILNWEVVDSDAAGISGGEEMGVLESSGMRFILEVKARGKKPTRIKKAKDALAKLPSTPTVELPQLPVLGADVVSKSQASSSSSIKKAKLQPASVQSALLPFGLASDGNVAKIEVAGEVASESGVQMEKTKSSGSTPAAAAVQGSTSPVRSHVPKDMFDPAGALRRLKQEPYYLDQCCYERSLRAREGKSILLDDPSIDFLSSRTKDALRSQWKVNSLYLHQVETIQASLQGNNVVLLTGTGSGKTLCFASVIAERIARSRGLDGDSSASGGGFLLPRGAFKAMCLYPTKALAQDQLRSLKSLFAREDVQICAIDGDSTPSERQTARESASVILTNPDFVHCTMLPKSHSEWREFISGLDLIVIDEAHTFNGAFGCHVAYVLRRILRIVDLHKNVLPSIFMCSATIGNPKETFRRLTGIKVSNVLISSSGVDEEDDPVIDRPSLLTPEQAVDVPVNQLRRLSPARQAVAQPLTNLEPNSVENDVSLSGGFATSVEQIHETIVAQGSQGKRRLTFSREAEINEPRQYEDEEEAESNSGVKQGAEEMSQAVELEPTLSDAPSDNLIIVDRDASPQGTRLVSLWRPKVLRILPDGREKRASAIFEIARIFASLVRQGVRVLAFCKTRKLVELVLKYSHDQLAPANAKAVSSSTMKEIDEAEMELLEEVAEEEEEFNASSPYVFPANDLRSKVLAYRAGYTKNERRDIEVKMFSGELLGICCTSALELGIDIGTCDCVLVLGVSGAASTMQMFGRAGRKGRNALNICVLFDGPLERALLRRPNVFLERKAEESAVFDVTNECIVKKHLLCASKEHPLDFTDEITLDSKLFDAALCMPYVRSMVEDDLVREDSGPKRFRILDKVPKPYDFSLRLIEGATIKLINDSTKEVLDEIEYFRAFFELYPGAIYLHQSRTYCVTFVDLTFNKEARAKRVQVDYYTSPLDSASVKVLRVFETKTEADRVMTGSVKVVRGLTGFRKLRFHLEDVWCEKRNPKLQKERFNVYLPPLEYTTRATWIDLAGDDFAAFDASDEREKRLWGSGLHAVQHLMCRAMRSLVLSHFSSIDTTHGAEVAPNRLIIFDKEPGGIGIADAVFSRIYECLELAKDMVDKCPCEDGCEDCIFDSMCSEVNWNCNKFMAKKVLMRAFEVIGPKSERSSVVRISSIFTTPRKMRRAKNMAKARAAGTVVVPRWKMHLPELGSEHVAFDHEL